METTYDYSCYLLAADFIDDSSANPMDRNALAHDLAQEIQQTIEDFMQERKIA